MKQKNRKKYVSHKSTAILLGSGICILSFLGVMLLSAMLIGATKNPLKNTDVFSSVAFAVAGLIAGLIGGRCLSEGKLFLFCPPLIMLTALLLGLLLSGGHIAPSALLSELIYLLASYLGFYLSRGGQKKHKRHHR